VVLGAEGADIFKHLLNKCINSTKKKKKEPILSSSSPVRLDLQNNLNIVNNLESSA